MSFYSVQENSLCFEGFLNFCAVTGVWQCPVCTNACQFKVFIFYFFVFPQTKIVATFVGAAIYFVFVVPDVEVMVFVTKLKFSSCFFSQKATNISFEIRGFCQIVFCKLLSAQGVCFSLRI
jgi:hypothetical protein